MAHLMLRWCSWLLTLRYNRSFCGQEATWRKPDEGMCRLFTRGGVFFNPGATFSAHHGEVLQHLSVHSALVELVFVLREADVVQPPFWIARKNKVRVGPAGNLEMPTCALGNLRVTQMKSSSADFSPCLLLTVLMASWSFFLCRGFFMPSSC